MKKSLLSLSLIIQIVTTFAATDSCKVFRHTFEVNFSPDLDYYSFSNTNSTYRQFTRRNFFPFIGFNLGVNYIYRLTENIGISAGINNQLFTYYQHLGTRFFDEIDPNWPATSVRINGYSYSGAVSFPLLLHLSSSIGKGNFEFVTGPEFYVPYYYINHFHINGGGVNYVYNSSAFLSRYGITQYASFGWNIQLGVEINLCGTSNLFIGPQLKFINIAYFEQGNDMDNPPPRLVDYSLAIKFGFRFGLKNHG